MLLTTVSVFADENRSLEVTGDYYSGNAFDFNDITYRVTVNSYYEVVIGYNEQFLVVRNGTCTNKGIHYQFCVDTIEYDADEEDKKATINVYSKESEIEITRSISDQSVIVGRSARITATLSNTGFSKAYNVTYTDSFPFGINISIPLKDKDGTEVRRDQKIILDNGSVIDAYTLFWQDDMDIGETVVFSYNITPQVIMEHPLVANVHYFNGYKEVDERSDSFDLTADPYFDLRFNVIQLDYANSAGITDIDNWETQSILYAGEEVYLVTDIYNTLEDNTSIDVSELRFYLPQGIEFLETSQFRIYGNSSDPDSSYLHMTPKLTKVNDHFYTWSGETSLVNELFVIKIKGNKEGEFLLRVAGDFNKDDLPSIFDYSKTIEIEVEKEDILIESNFEDSGEFDSGKQEYFTLYLVNPNEFVNFTNVNVSVYAEWLGERKYHFNKVNASNYVDVINEYVTLPTVVSDTTFSLDVNVTYTTQFGENINETLEREIKIKPISPFIIEHEIGDSTVTNSGSIKINNEKTEIILKIKNTHARDIESITVTEVFDEELNPVNAISNKLVKLKEDEESEVYRYKINPPDVSRWQNFTINTDIIYPYQDEMYNNSFEVIVEVRPKKLELEVKKELFEGTITRGQIAHVNYRIKNTEDEPIKDITIYFPMQYGTDLVGPKTYKIDKILSEETVIVTNQERVRPKISGNLKFRRANITFWDEFGNKFNDTSPSVSEDIEEGSLETAAILVNLSAPTTINVNEEFIVKAIVSNIGKKSSSINIEYGGKEQTLRLSPGQVKELNYSVSVDSTGLVELPRAVVDYEIKGIDYYTASEPLEVYSREKVVRKPIVIEEPIEEVVVEKKRIFNIKYLYLLAFIIFVSLIILYILRRPKEKEGFEFIEK